jgi:hypothetical protein
MKAITLLGCVLCAGLQGCDEKPVTRTCPSLLPGWTQPKDGMDEHGVHSTVTMAGERVLLDGQTETAAEFERHLREAPRMNPVLHILFDPSGARNCREAERVRNQIDGLADCRGKGLCGQGSASEFKRLRDGGAVWRVKERSGFTR